MCVESCWPWKSGKQGLDYILFVEEEEKHKSDLLRILNVFSISYSANIPNVVSICYFVNILDENILSERGLSIYTLVLNVTIWETKWRF